MHYPNIDYKKTNIKEFWNKFEAIIKFTRYKLGDKLDLESEADKQFTVKNELFEKFYEEKIWLREK